MRYSFNEANSIKTKSYYKIQPVKKCRDNLNKSLGK